MFLVTINDVVWTHWVTRIELINPIIQGYSPDGVSKRYELMKFAPRQAKLYWHNNQLPALNSQVVVQEKDTVIFKGKVTAVRFGEILCEENEVQQL